LKNIFKIHPLTYFILLTVLLAGYFNYFLIISFILIMHDLGHIILFKLFNYQINKITILPFGSIIDTNIKLNDKTMHIFLISIAGVLMQLMLYPIMSLFLNTLDHQIFFQYNTIILCFNLLPIIPLDGSKIMGCLFE